MKRLKSFLRKVVELFVKWETEFDDACAKLKKDGIDIAAKLNSSSLDR